MNAITMQYSRGQFLPDVDEDKCTRCGLCLKLCPGIDINPFLPKYDRIALSTFDNPSLESYIAYSKDARIRANSVSGGMITTLITELITSRKFDAAFVLTFETFDGTAARLKAKSDIEEMFHAAKSKYLPASAYEIIKALEKDENKKYIIVGTPCLLYGLKKYLSHKKMSEDDLLLLGLFCEKTLNFNIIRYLEESYKKSDESLVWIEYRTKEKSGWPGNVKLLFSSGRGLIVNRKVRMRLKKYFQLNRCLFCLDKLNVSADIAFGDCYIKPGADRLGKSSVIVRTEKGRDILQQYSHLFTLESQLVSRIRESQSLISKRDNLEYARIFAKTNNMCGNVAANYKPGVKAVKKLSLLQKYIRWGRNYNIRKIKYSKFISNITKTSRRIFDAARILVAMIFAAGYFFRLVAAGRSTKRKCPAKKGRNVIVLGGQLSNKGAQAMTFVVVSEIKRRFPDMDIYLFCTKDFNRDDAEKDLYNFKFLPMAPESKIRLLLGPVVKDNTTYAYMEKEVKQVLRDAAFIIDISGYVLSSQWSFFSSLRYLTNILLAQKYSIPFYIFPQSLGPFDYPLLQKLFLFPLLRLSLGYPRMIFLREEGALKHVQRFTSSNVKQSCDIVLQSRGYDLSNIYSAKMDFTDFTIESGSVGIIPNLRVLRNIEEQKLHTIYRELIHLLTEAGRTVYILRHSEEDLPICRDIKNSFADEPKVKLIQNDLNAIELENVIRQFQFVIASRYHSIIHSYRNKVPAIVIGWAEKYYQLLKNFDQLQYYFDCRGSINIDDIKTRLNKMMENCASEKEKIAETVDSLAAENAFDILENDLAQH